MVASVRVHGNRSCYAWGQPSGPCTCKLSLADGKLRYAHVLSTQPQCTYIVHRRSQAAWLRFKLLQTWSLHLQFQPRYFELFPPVGSVQSSRNCLSWARTRASCLASRGAMASASVSDVKAVTSSRRPFTGFNPLSPRLAVLAHASQRRDSIRPTLNSIARYRRPSNGSSSCSAEGRKSAQQLEARRAARLAGARPAASTAWEELGVRCRPRRRVRSHERLGSRARLESRASPVSSRINTWKSHRRRFESTELCVSLRKDERGHGLAARPRFNPQAVVECSTRAAPPTTATRCQRRSSATRAPSPTRPRTTTRRATLRRVSSMLT